MEGKASPPPGLSRLPPGRHGLSREFVAQNQRDRLTAGIIAAVAEHGYEKTTITNVVSAAGLSRRTFYAYFKTKEECYLATCEEIAEHLRGAAKGAEADSDDWGEKVKARLVAVLAALAANPDLANFLLVAPARAGGELSEQYSAAVMKAFVELTGDAPREIQRLSSAVEYGLAGGSVWLVVRTLDAGEGTRLEELIPDLVKLILGPYLGHSKAAELSQTSA
ncbi:MAG TPA: TetR/AcrR family transcriptional regulator [Solirubrobacterales bacterium]